MMAFRGDVSSGKEEIGVGVDIVNWCNLKCKQCYYQNCPSLEMLTLEQMRLVIEKVKREFSWFYLLGGEPTLHPQIQQIVELALKEMNGGVMLVTNGLKLADAKFCKSIALPGLALSMHKKADRPTAGALVDALVQQPGAFQLMQKAWTNAIKYWQGNVYAQLNLLKPLVKEGHALEVLKWARKMGIEPLIELSKASPIFERGNPLDVALEDIETLYGLMLDHDKTYYPHKAPEVIVPPYYGHACTLIETSIHILVDGTVVPCVGNRTPAYGNIFTDDLGKILASPLRAALRDYKNWIVGPCRNCQYFDHCRGGCRGEARYDTGCLRASDPYCWHHPKGLTLKDMVPKSCNGCLLEDNPECNIKI